MLAHNLAPILFLQADEWFTLERSVAVLHPTRRLIAYHLLWRDDVHGSWIPFTIPTDQEIVWIGYDLSGAPTDMWTYWHGSILHTPWTERGHPKVDIQWGKHGSLPHRTIESDLPRTASMNSFYAFTWIGLPDIWLSNLTRRGPWCFCRDYARYRRFDRELPLAPRLDAIVRSADPDTVLRRVFGRSYSRKTPWPAHALDPG